MMNPRRAVVVGTFGCLMSANALAQTQPTCPKGFQPYANRCISQRMADYISCVEASGGNSERIAYEVSNADAGKTGVGVKGSGSGMVIKGSGSVTVDRATEKALASKFEHTWTDKGMEECRKVLDPPKSPHHSSTDNPQKSPNASGPTPSQTAIAPNGIAISGGNVSNPTVNNITALPDVTMSDEQEKRVSDSIGDLFAGADVTVTAVQPDQNTRDVSSRLVRIFKSKGANVEYDTAQMYIPAAGMTLHKGVSITSFPFERKAAVDTFVKALGDAGVVKVVPIYDRPDKKIGVVVNHSADTREEAKQY